MPCVHLTARLPVQQAAIRQIFHTVEAIDLISGFFGDLFCDSLMPYLDGLSIVVGFPGIFL